MSDLPPWNRPNWQTIARAHTEAALVDANYLPVDEFETIRSTGRSFVQKVKTNRGIVWVKHSYRLSPGEEVVLAHLSLRHPGQVPTVVASWPGAFAMQALPGEELTDKHPLHCWVAAAKTIASVEVKENAYVDEWLKLGVRDRRSDRWASALQGLVDGAVFNSLDVEIQDNFRKLMPEFVRRYVDSFETSATLVHQDSGCCNIHISAEGAVLFDWSDVVVGHPAFSCDRLLDQAPKEYRQPVIEAFVAASSFSQSEYDKMRRSNVVHEILRYHDELTYLSPEDEIYRNLVDAIASQLVILLEYERSI